MNRLVNPCSHAEADERFERELFEARARASEPVVVPSLASVLRAASAPSRETERRSARGRVVAAMAVAAACMTATLSTLPKVGRSGTIEPDVSAGAAATHPTTGPQTRPTTRLMSTFDEGLSGVAASYSSAKDTETTVFASMPAACFSQVPAAAPIEPGGTLTCEHEPTCSITER